MIVILVGQERNDITKIRKFAKLSFENDICVGAVSRM